MEMASGYLEYKTSVLKFRTKMNKSVLNFRTLFIYTIFGED